MTKAAVVNTSSLQNTTVDQQSVTKPVDQAFAILNSLTDPVFVIDGDNRITFANQAAEQFLHSSTVVLIGSNLNSHFVGDSPLVQLVEQTRREQSSVAEYGVRLDTPRIGNHLVALVISPVQDQADHCVVTVQQQSIARKIDHQLVHRNAARSITAMGAMLAHEVKNPLSGIRGAAQLLELNADDDDRQLTRLICDEADRIVKLVDRMEMFSDTRPLEKTAVNIHEVLSHVRLLAESGFGQGILFTERYDPSLPEVYGNRDLLIQALLNLVKNSAEAIGKSSGEIIITTSYQQGVRMRLPGGGERMELPMLVTVEDNGPGIPEDLHRHLFDPFVSTKAGGKGLGLALVSKVIEDHGGVIELESASGLTRFSINLPLAPKEMREDFILQGKSAGSGKRSPVSGNQNKDIN
ncbi:two-component system sensor histidine kinase NtrB [Kiloniella laminariae]|uniref:two-component system sensor histidine kinase NtrB n=1 Tax=Kiloniella laminariae TaxID=454162 RepID=UPI00038062D6|nr:ATP-binding protein [Kiloniella laminariae]